MLNSDVLTVKEVADYLKMCPVTIYRLAKGGKIPAFKIGGDWRFKKISIETWIADLEGGNGNGNGRKKSLKE